MGKMAREKERERKSVCVRERERKREREGLSNVIENNLVKICLN